MTISKKKIKIKKLLITFTFLCLISTFSFSLLNSYASGNQNNLKEVMVEKGDTLWVIAKQVNPKGDIRKTIYEIKELNQLDENIIYPGQVILVPAL